MPAGLDIPQINGFKCVCRLCLISDTVSLQNAFVFSFRRSKKPAESVVFGSNRCVIVSQLTLLGVSARQGEKELPAFFFYLGSIDYRGGDEESVENDIQGGV